MNFSIFFLRSENGREDLRYVLHGIEYTFFNGNDDVHAVFTPKRRRNEAKTFLFGTIDLARF